MFQPRSTDFFNPRVTAIVDHLRAIEKELLAISKKSGRRASANASVAGDQIADAIGPVLNDLVNRFRRGQRAAVGGAADLGGEAAKFGSKVGRKTAGRLAVRIEERPFVTLAVAIGVGILIGVAARRA
jgi:ElaB/YqjD/DUF883 family membrane-anchored ribosome-binding protein